MAFHVEHFHGFGRVSGVVPVALKMTARFLRLEEDSFTDDHGQEVPYMTLVVDDGDATQRVSIPRDLRRDARTLYAAAEYGSEVAVEVSVSVQAGTASRPARIRFRAERIAA